MCIVHLVIFGRKVLPWSLQTTIKQLKPPSASTGTFNISQYYFLPWTWPWFSIRPSSPVSTPPWHNFVRHIPPTCNLDHCILPMHRYAFRQANFAPYVSSVSDNWYVPDSSISFWICSNRFLCAGEFNLANGEERNSEKGLLNNRRNELNFSWKPQQFAII